MEPQVARLARKRKSGTDIDIFDASPGRLVDVLRHTENNQADPTSAAMERRILDGLDETSTGSVAAVVAR